MNDTPVTTNLRPPNQEQVDIEKDSKTTPSPSRDEICGLANTNPILPGHSTIQLSSVDQGVIKIERYMWPCECSPYCDCTYDDGEYDKVNVTDESWLPLLQPCRQIYLEARPVWFVVNKFYFALDYENISWLLRWIDFCAQHGVMHRMDVVLLFWQRMNVGTDHCYRDWNHHEMLLLCQKVHAYGRKWIPSVYKSYLGVKIENSSTEVMLHTALKKAALPWEDCRKELIALIPDLGDDGN